MPGVRLATQDKQTNYSKEQNAETLSFTKQRMIGLWAGSHQTSRAKFPFNAPPSLIATTRR